MSADTLTGVAVFIPDLTEATGPARAFETVGGWSYRVHVRTRRSRSGFSGL